MKKKSQAGLLFLNNGSCVDPVTGELYTASRAKRARFATAHAQLQVTTPQVNPLDLCNELVAMPSGITGGHDTVRTHLNTRTNGVYVVFNANTFGVELNGLDHGYMLTEVKKRTAMAAKTFTTCGLMSRLAQMFDGSKMVYDMSVRVDHKHVGMYPTGCPYAKSCRYGRACMSARGTHLVCEHQLDMLRRDNGYVRTVVNKGEFVKNLLWRLGSGQSRVATQELYTVTGVLPVTKDQRLLELGRGVHYTQTRSERSVFTVGEFFIDIDLPECSDTTARTAEKVEVLDRILNCGMPVSWVLETTHGLHVHIVLKQMITADEFDQLAPRVLAYFTRYVSPYVDMQCRDKVRLYKIPFCDSNDQLEDIHRHVICTPVVVGGKVQVDTVRAVLDGRMFVNLEDDAELASLNACTTVEKPEHAASKHAPRQHTGKLVGMSDVLAAKLRASNKQAVMRVKGLRGAMLRLDVDAARRELGLTAVADRPTVDPRVLDRLAAEHLDLMTHLNPHGHGAISDWMYKDTTPSMVIKRDGDAWRFLNFAHGTVCTLSQYLHHLTGRGWADVNAFLAELLNVNLHENPVDDVNHDKVTDPVLRTHLATAKQMIAKLHRRTLAMVDELVAVHGVTELDCDRLRDAVRTVLDALKCAGLRGHLQPLVDRLAPVTAQQFLCSTKFIINYAAYRGVTLTKHTVNNAVRLLVACGVIRREDRAAFTQIAFTRRDVCHNLAQVLGFRDFDNPATHAEVVAAAKDVQMHIQERPLYRWTVAYVNTWCRYTMADASQRTGFDPASVRVCTTTLTDDDKPLAADVERRVFNDLHRAIGTHAVVTFAVKQDVGSLVPLAVYTQPVLRRLLRQLQQTGELDPGQLARTFKSPAAVAEYLATQPEQRLTAEDAMRRVLLTRAATNWAWTKRAPRRVARHRLSDVDWCVAVNFSKAA